MRVWTTPGLERLFSGERRLRVLGAGELKVKMPLEARAGDIAVLPFSADYADFLASGCPVIFISSRPLSPAETDWPQNAVVLEESSLGPGGTGKVVDFILNVAAGRYPGGSAAAGFRHGTGAEERPAGARPDIRALLRYSMEKDLPVMVALQRSSEGGCFTARGRCNVKAMKDDLLLLDGFKPGALVNDLKLEPVADMCGVGDIHGPGGGEGRGRRLFWLRHQLFAIFTWEDGGRYEALLRVLGVDGPVVSVSIPDRMVRERRRHVRVEPAPGRPVELFAQFEGGPTVGLRVTDISRRGVGFLGGPEARPDIGPDIGENDEGIFAVFLPGDGNAVISRGVVRFKRRCGSLFRYGVELLVSQCDEEKIRGYVLARERETAETTEEK